MTRHTGTRFAVIATLSAGLLAALAPHGAAASTGTAGDDDRAPIAAVGQHLWPVEALSLPSVVEVEVAPATDDTIEPATEATDDTAEAPTPVAAEEVPDVTPEPAPDPAPAPAPTPDEEPAVASTGTIHVDITTTEGATRTVSLRSADGTLVAGPVAVEGTPITFGGLDDGTYDVLAEQRFDGGGTFVTRTVVDVAGGETTLTCDAETLDCTVS